MRSLNKRFLLLFSSFTFCMTQEDRDNNGRGQDEQGNDNNRNNPNNPIFGFPPSPPPIGGIPLPLPPPGVLPPNAPPLAPRRPKLADLVKIGETKRLFGVLDDAVSKQYGNPRALAVRRPNPLAIARNADPFLTPNAGLQDILFQQDVAVTLLDLNNLIGSSGKKKKRQAEKLSADISKWWNQGVVYYGFDVAMAPSTRTVIQQAITFYEQNTCVRFHLRTTQAPYLWFTDQDVGCWSYVGRQSWAVEQPVSIGAGCARMSIVAHEIAHALGVNHEQTRYDRDTFLTLDLSNVNEGSRRNYALESSATTTLYVLPYDYGSVMHYNPIAFAIDSKNPVTDTKMPNYFYNLGNNIEPSFRDVLTINTHYQCMSRCPSNPSLVCQNNGYRDPNNCNVCKCPPGYADAQCSSLQPPTVPGCGGLLIAAAATRMTTITVPAAAQTTTPRKCIYHIRGGINKQIIVGADSVSASCEYGCSTSGVEMKTSNDQRITGVRYCCSNGTRSVLASTRTSLPVLVYSTGSATTVTIRYYQRDPPTTTGRKKRSDEENENILFGDDKFHTTTQKKTSDFELTISRTATDKEGSDLDVPMGA